jgi:hypothetical protein
MVASPVEVGLLAVDGAELLAVAGDAEPGFAPVLELELELQAAAQSARSAMLKASGRRDGTGFMSVVLLILFNILFNGNAPRAGRQWPLPRR